MSNFPYKTKKFLTDESGYLIDNESNNIQNQIK